MKKVNLQFSTISFPLNVYAHALYLEEGRADYLHYGLFKKATDNIIEAQNYSTQLLVAQLPPPPCKILEVGSGLGTTLKILYQMGYEVDSITPDNSQIHYIQKQWNNDAPVHCQYFETYQEKQNSFDIILLQESAQYIEPLVIFNQALNYLKETGSLIILDEFVLIAKNFEQNHLHHLQDILSLAKRYHFSIKQQLNLSSYATPTLSYLLKIITKHKQSLINDLGVSIKQLEQLNHANQCYQRHYIAGNYGYALIHLTKESLPKWRIQKINKQHLDSVQKLFKLSFNKTLSKYLWQWKYGNPQALQLGIYNAEQKLIAHYGGMPRKILYFSKHKLAVQIGDVMVNPKYRGALRRTGPFFLLAANFIEHYIGFGKIFLLGFGFPNSRAMQVAEHLGLYKRVDHITEIIWPITTAGFSIFSTLRILHASKLSQYQTTINRLWQQMADDFTQDIIGIRDYDYIEQRYNKHPEINYQILLVKNRYNSIAKGLMVVQIAQETCHIIDIICNRNQIPLLIHYVQRYAATQQCKKVSIQISAAFSHYFMTSNACLTHLDIHIASNNWSAGPTPKLLNNHWWLMAGDMDFR